MIGLEDRRSLAQDIDTANTAGARLHLACVPQASTCEPCSAGRRRQTASYRGMPGLALYDQHLATLLARRSVRGCRKLPTSRALARCHRRASCP